MGETKRDYSPKTCDLAAEDRCNSVRYECLIREQALLLRRAMISADILRGMVAQLGGDPGRPPDDIVPRGEAERKLAREARLNGLDRRREEEMITVPAADDMNDETMRLHLEKRHRGVTSRARHTVQHAAGLVSFDHEHLRTRAEIRRADIRYGGIEPSHEETLFISGYDGMGATDE
jgi:hypothetical protein